MAIDSLDERRALRRQYMDRLAGSLPAVELDRIDSMLSVWCRDSLPSLQPLQSVVSDTFMPDLTSTTWFDTSLFEFVPELERHYEPTRRGYHDAMSHRRLVYYSTNPQGSNPSLPASRRVPHFPEGWKELPVAHGNTIYPDNLVYFPFLAKLYRRMVSEDRAPKTLSFLVMEPGTILRDHVDPKNFFVTVQFGITIPPGDCFLRAGEHKRQWEPGKCFAFDNSFYHSAWNHTAEDRIVLAIHTYHPGLTRAERKAIAMLADYHDETLLSRGLKGYNPWR